MTNQSFDNLVKQKATEHEAPVPTGVWEAIVKEKNKKRYPLFWWVTGCILGLIAAGIGIIYIATDNHEHQAGQQKSIVQKPNASPEEKDNDASVVVPTDSSKHLNIQKISSDENKKALAMLPSRVTTASVLPNDKDDQSGNTTIQYSNQTSSVSISALFVQNKKVRLTKSSLQKNNLLVTSSYGKLNTALTDKKNTSDNTNLMALTDSMSSGFTKDPQASFLISYKNDNNDSFIDIEKKMISRNKSGYSLLVKQWNDLSVGHPAVADNMIKPVTPAIKRIHLKPSTWSLDLSVIPFQPIQQKHSLLSLSRTTTNDMHTAEYKPEEVSTTLKPALAYSLSVNKRINKQIQIGAGLQYTVIKEHLTLSGTETNTDYQVVQRLDNSGSTPVLVTDTVASVTTGTRIIGAINSYRLLEIPIQLQYTLIEKRDWSLRLIGGVQLGISAKYNNSINGKLVPQYSSGDHQQNSTAMRVGFFTGARLTNRLNSKYQLFAAPYLRISAGNYNTKTIINNKSIHQVGVAVGVSYKIGR